MALNWTMLSPERTPVPLPNEKTIMTIEEGAEITLTVPDSPPVAGAASGGSGGAKTLKGVGRIYLTDQRLIFVAPVFDQSFDSLSIPLASILSTSFEQPFFGANYLQFGIRPSPDGGLSNETTAQLRLKDRGLFQFVSTLEKTRERAIYMKRQADSEADTLPLYDPPEESRTPEPVTGQSTSRQIQDFHGEAPPGYDV